MKVYLSGPITGLSEEQFTSAFNQAEEVALSLDWVAGVVNPCKVDPCATKDCHPPRALVNRFSDGSIIHHWTCYMRYDIKAMMECQALILLPGWRNSKGARLEFDLAYSLEFRIETFNADITGLLED